MSGRCPRSGSAMLDSLRHRSGPYLLRCTTHKVWCGPPLQPAGARTRVEWDLLSASHSRSPRKPKRDGAPTFPPEDPTGGSVASRLGSQSIRLPRRLGCHVQMHPPGHGLDLHVASRGVCRVLVAGDQTGGKVSPTREDRMPKKPADPVGPCEQRDPWPGHVVGSQSGEKYVVYHRCVKLAHSSPVHLCVCSHAWNTEEDHGNKGGSVASGRDAAPTGG